MVATLLFKLNKELTVKVYHGYGDNEMLLIMGHVFKRSPFPPKSYKNNILKNTRALIKLFMAVPYEHAGVSIQWKGKTLHTTTNENGFFKLEWDSEDKLEPGWHRLNVKATGKNGAVATGEGKLLIPRTSEYTCISDIDDTFLVSHSSNLAKRLRVLFTKNPQTRKPFENVARHYQLLAGQDENDGMKNPFFYVSSSEWNLYEYIKEFCRTHKLPEGVFLLSTLKRWYELLATGQGKHETKYTRIVRIISTFPDRKYILLGDDTQQDPDIYQKVVDNFPDKILCVYIRQVEKKNYEQTKERLQKVITAGVEVKYYKHSADAIAHSKGFGLIQ